MPADLSHPLDMPNVTTAPDYFLGPLGALRVKR